MAWLQSAGGRSTPQIANRARRRRSDLPSGANASGRPGARGPAAGTSLPLRQAATHNSPPSDQAICRPLGRGRQPERPAPAITDRRPYRFSTSEQANRCRTALHGERLVANECKGPATCGSFAAACRSANRNGTRLLSRCQNTEPPATALHARLQAVELQARQFLAGRPLPRTQCVNVVSFAIHALPAPRSRLSGLKSRWCRIGGSADQRRTSAPVTASCSRQAAACWPGLDSRSPATCRPATGRTPPRNFSQPRPGAAPDRWRPPLLGHHLRIQVPAHDHDCRVYLTPSGRDERLAVRRERSGHDFGADRGDALAPSRIDQHEAGTVVDRQRLAIGRERKASRACCFRPEYGNFATAGHFPNGDSIVADGGDGACHRPRPP